jgi:phosphoglycerate dehydrogenase-like enzyme
MDNVIVTPHCLGWTDEAWEGKWEENLRQVSGIIRGEVPESLVNREVWDKPQFQLKLRKFHESLK